MDKLKIFCKDSEDAKNKLNILERYGIDIGHYNGDVQSSVYYILDEKDKKIVNCYKRALFDRVNSIPEVWYDFFNISAEARAKAYSNCCDYTKDVTVNLLEKGINCWFIWENTPEGQSYWKKWYETLRGINSSQTPALKEEKKEKSSARFKVGDKVFICLCANKDYPFSYSPEMLTYNGKIATIIKVETDSYSPNNSDEDGCEYKLNINGLDTKWAWSSPMLLAPPAVEFVESNISILDKGILDYSTLKLKSYESRLQEQETNLSGRNGAKPVRFHGGKHQVRIASKHLSYQKAVGRG